MELRVLLDFVILVDRHVQKGVARAKQVANSVAFSGTTACLIYEILEEVDSSDLPPGEESTDQRHLHVECLASAISVRHAAEHLLTRLAALVLALPAEEADFAVIDLDFWDDSARAFQLKRTDLCSPAMRNTRLDGHSADKVFADHEDRLAILVISRLGVRRALRKHKRVSRQRFVTQLHR